MTPYTSAQSLQSALPRQHLADALDDDRDGQPDEGLLEQIVADASNAVDACLAGRYAVPFATPPAAAKAAALVFACELIYDRRQMFQENPWRARADVWRERLQRIGRGELPLELAADQAAGPGRWGSRPRLWAEPES
jgi:phage gp36-like protein